MGFIKWLIDKFSCKSSCRFNINETEFNNELNKYSLDNFKLKHKDVLKIHSILTKRQLVKKINSSIII